MKLEFVNLSIGRFYMICQNQALQALLCNGLILA
jgi:hypothetical protein